MAESRQLSVRLSEATFARLESIKPEGVTLAEVARKVIEKQLGTGTELPSLGGGGGKVVAAIDWRPFEAHVAEVRAEIERLDERLRETQRAAQEHGAWSRMRLTPKGDAEMDRKAANAGEQAVRDWERSVGR